MGWYPCCKKCTYFSDDFDRDDDTDLGDDWTEVAGDSSIDDNNLLCDDTGAINTCNEAEPGGNPENVLHVKILAEAVGDQAKIGVDYVDENNYWFVLFDFKNAAQMDMKLYRREGGVDTWHQTVTNIIIALDTWYPVTVCVGPGSVVGVFDNTVDAVGRAATPTSSTVFLGAGTVNTAIRFNDFTVARHYFNNEDCEFCRQGCRCCEPLTAPPAYAVTIAGVVNRDPPICTDCDDWNGCWTTFLGIHSFSYFCLWEKSDDELPCPHGDDPSIVNVWHDCTDFPGEEFDRVDIWAQVQLNNASGGGIWLGATYQKTILIPDALIDCSDNDNYGNIPLVFWPASSCDFAGSTLSIAIGRCPGD